MKHLFIRSESKVKGKIGRGNTVVLFDTRTQAAQSLFTSLLETHGHTSEQFEFTFTEDHGVVIRTYNDHDYYRWLDVLNTPIHYVEVDTGEVVGKNVTAHTGANRFNIEEVTPLVARDTSGTLDEFIIVELLRPAPTALEEPIIPLVEIVDYGDTYDLPIAGAIKGRSILGRLFKFLGNLTTRPEEDDLIGKSRKPFVVFESYLGGHIAIYKSLTTGREVDVALFNRYGGIINVFSFQDGCPHTNGINGFTIEDLISISTWRILHLNESVHSDENIEAVLKLNSAIDILENRGLQRAKEALVESE